MAELDPPREVAPNVFLLDTGYIRPRLAACYVVRGGRSAAIVDTGTTLSAPGILAALAKLGIAREHVSHVAPTHAHLDHAGGSGALLAALPKARLVAHPRAARHLIDPAKLIAGSVVVYGKEKFDALYGTIVPAPAERVDEAPDGFTFDLGGRVLTALDAPGHAKHHYVLHDPASKGFFTGDCFGISYRETDSPAGTFIFPTTTPVQFDPAALHQTVDRMMSFAPERMYLTHYGMIAGDVPRAAKALHAGIDAHVAAARSAKPGPGRHTALVEGLATQLATSMQAHGVPLTHEEARRLYAGDLDLNAQGLGVWLDAEAKA